MPIHKVTKNGKTGYEWGNHGKVYPTKEGAEKQAMAAYSNGYSGDSGRVGFEYELEPSGKSVREDAEFGRMKIKKFRLSKEGINQYRGSELTQCEELNLDPNRIYNLYRPLSELRKAAHTFDMVPITVEHPKQFDTPFREQQREGATGSDARIEGKYLVNSGKLWGLDAIHGLDTSTRREVSIFSKFDVEMKSGEFDGKPYDGIIRNIVGNSVALTIVGRAGSDVAVGDSRRVIKMEKEIKAILRKYGTPDSELSDIRDELMELIDSNNSQHGRIEKDLDELKRGEKKELKGHKKIQRELTGRDSDWEDEDSDLDDKIEDRKKRRSKMLDDEDSDIDDYEEEKRGQKDSDLEYRKEKRERRRDDEDSDREYRKERRARRRDDEDSDLDEKREYRKKKRERDIDDRDSRRYEGRPTGDSMELIIREAERRATEKAQRNISETIEAMRLAERAYGATNLGAIGDSAVSIYKTILRAENIPTKGINPEGLRGIAEYVVNNKLNAQAVGDSRVSTSDFDDMLPIKFRGNK